MLSSAPSVLHPDMVPSACTTRECPSLLPSACSAWVLVPLPVEMPCVGVSGYWHRRSFRVGRNQAARLIITVRVYKTQSEPFQPSGGDRQDRPGTPHSRQCVTSLIRKFLFLFSCPKLVMTLQYFLSMEVVDTLTFRSVGKYKDECKNQPESQHILPDISVSSVFHTRILRPVFSTLSKKKSWNKE